MVGCEDTRALCGECAKLGEGSGDSEVAAGVLAHAAPCAERAVAAPERRCAHGTGGWYVIQVPTGKEAALCAVIERVAGPGELSECFVPSFETQRKVRGVSEFTRLLTMGESFVPLDDADRAWLSAFTTADDRAIPMSMGVVEGDRIVVTQGPLMGHEGWITSVNRRKSLAFIQVEMFGRKIETRIGLGIVRRKPCPNSNVNQEKSESAS